MGNINDVRTACEIIQKYEQRIVILQCTSSYPAPFSEINLNVIKQYSNVFKSAVFSAFLPPDLLSPECYSIEERDDPSLGS